MPLAMRSPYFPEDDTAECYHNRVLLWPCESARPLGLSNGPCNLMPPPTTLLGCWTNARCTYLAPASVSRKWLVTLCWRDRWTNGIVAQGSATPLPLLVLRTQDTRFGMHMYACNGGARTKADRADKLNGRPRAQNLGISWRRLIRSSRVLTRLS